MYIFFHWLFIKEIGISDTNSIDEQPTAEVDDTIAIVEKPIENVNVSPEANVEAAFESEPPVATAEKSIESVIVSVEASSDKEADLPKSLEEIEKESCDDSPIEMESSNVTSDVSKVHVFIVSCSISYMKTEH